MYSGSGTSKKTMPALMVPVQKAGGNKSSCRMLWYILRDRIALLGFSWLAGGCWGCSAALLAAVANRPAPASSSSSYYF